MDSARAEIQRKIPWRRLRDQDAARIAGVGAGWRESAEAAARPGIVEMDDGTEQGHDAGDCRDGLCWVEGGEDGPLAGTDAVLDGAIVFGMADRAVDGQDAAVGEEAVDDVRVEGCAIVAFEEQRRTVAGDEKADQRRWSKADSAGRTQGSKWKWEARSRARTTTEPGSSG